MLILSIYLLFLISFIALLGYAFYRFVVGKFGVRAKRIESRLNVLVERSFIQPTSASIFKQRVFSKNEEIDHFLKKCPPFHFVDILILRAGLKCNLHQFLMFLLGIFFIIFSLTVGVTGSYLKAFFCGIVFASIPFVILKIQNSKRQTLIQNQLPDILEYIARSLNAGHSFNSAIQTAALESPEPIGSEFKMTFDQLNLGVSIRDAMNNLIKRIDTEDIRFFAVAVSINREAGGNLSELLGEVSSMMRARLASKLSVKALAAEGKASATVLGALPVLVLMLILVFAPNYYDPLMKSEMGSTVIFSTLGIMAFGLLWMKNMTNIQI